jgi:hypothetical protein
MGTINGCVLSNSDGSALTGSRRLNRYEPHILSKIIENDSSLLIQWHSPWMVHRELNDRSSNLSLTRCECDMIRLYCGFDTAIEKLDINSPGRHSSKRIHTSKTRSSKDGQKGVVHFTFSSAFTDTVTRKY